MNIKEFLELCIDKYCSFIIYDETTNKCKNFTFAEGVLLEYGRFPVKGWRIEKVCGCAKMLIKTRT